MRKSPGNAAATQGTVKEQRVTKQRLAVSAALDQIEDFVSTQELHRILHDQGAPVSLATSYRILQSLAQDGDVDVLRTEDGEARYRRCAAATHHHHLVCKECGKAVEVEAPDVESWVNQIAQQQGFYQVNHVLEIIGLCPDCSPAANNAADTTH